MFVSQNAGVVDLKVYTEGLHPQIQLFLHNRYRNDLDISDLHDLRYCIDRILNKMEILRKE